MAKINRTSEMETQTESQVNSPRKTSVSFARMLSIESCTGDGHFTYYSGPINRDYRKSYCSFEFLLKLLQLLAAIICVAIYPQGSKLLINSITSYMFPYVISGSFMIITSVILIGFVINKPMPDILIRVFNMLACLLFFVSACITCQVTYVWFSQSQDDQEYLENPSDEDYEDFGGGKQNADALIAVTVFSFLNSFLYALDVFYSFKQILDDIDNLGYTKSLKY